MTAYCFGRSLSAAMGNLQHNGRAVAVNRFGQLSVFIDYLIAEYFKHFGIRRNAVLTDCRIARDNTADLVFGKVLIFFNEHFTRSAVFFSQAVMRCASDYSVFDFNSRNLCFFKKHNYFNKSFFFMNSIVSSTVVKARATLVSAAP